MNWFLWFLVGFFMYGGLVTITLVGKPRKPLQADVAAVVVFIDALVIAGIFLFGAAR